jgi:hypothetical protein
LCLLRNLKAFDPKGKKHKSLHNYCDRDATHTKRLIANLECISHESLFNAQFDPALSSSALIAHSLAEAKGVVAVELPEKIALQPSAPPAELVVSHHAAVQNESPVMQEPQVSPKAAVSEPVQLQEQGKVSPTAPMQQKEEKPAVGFYSTQRDPNRVYKLAKAKREEPRAVVQYRY